MTSRRGTAVTSAAQSLAMLALREEGNLTLAEVASLFGLSSYASAGSTITGIRSKLAG
jgi:hypothetical protein